MDGEPFAGCLFPRDGDRPRTATPSKHLGNVVDPDELVERYGADTVRLAVLYAAGPAKTLNWNDGAIRFARRFLTRCLDYSQERFAAAASAPTDAETASTPQSCSAPAQMVRERVGADTADLENLQMHTAVRNVTRLFERIEDFEKLQNRAAAGRLFLSSADADAQVHAGAVCVPRLSPLPSPHTRRRGAADRLGARGRARVCRGRGRRWLPLSHRGGPQASRRLTKRQFHRGLHQRPSAL